jgi:pilus assembly protein Flp/PilA
MVVVLRYIRHSFGYQRLLIWRVLRICTDSFWRLTASLRDQIQLPFMDRRYGGLMKTIHRFLADESGATAIEYGLIAAGIALAIISAVQGVGTKLKTNFTTISTSLK